MTDGKVVRLHAADSGIYSTQRTDPYARLVIAYAEVQRAAVLRGYFSKISALRERINYIDAGLKVQTEKLRKNVADLRAHGFQNFKPKFMPSLYWVLIGFAAVMEVPLNESALAVLRMGIWETFSSAVFVALLNTIAASLVGSELRRMEFAPTYIRSWCMALFVIVFVVFAMWGIAQLRYEIIALDYGAEAARAGWWGFIGMQGLFFAVAVYMSFTMHHPDPAIERVLSDFRRSWREVRSLHRRRKRPAARFNRALGQTRARLQEIEANALRLVSEYRYENARTRRATPVAFQDAIDTDVFRPIDLGRRVDPNPLSLEDILNGKENAS